MKKEIWKFHPYFGQLVQFSNLGRVKSFIRNHKTGQILNNKVVNSAGYLRVSILGRKYFIHRVIAELFVPNPDNKPEVNHKDGNKTNNKADNLEWVTRSENMKRAYKLGLQKSSEKQKQAVSKWNKEHRIKKVYQYDTKGNLLNIFKSQQEAAKILNLSEASISRILNGQRNNRKNYILTYNKKEAKDGTRAKIFEYTN